MYRPKIIPRAICVIALCLVVLGFAGVGKGLWIYAKAIVAQYLLESAWAETMSSERRIVKPWPWADTWPVARLSMERLQVDMIVLNGDNGSALAFGPGHTTMSTTPGQRGVSIISGHRDTHFNFLKDVQTGDEIVVQVPDGTEVRYRVDQAEVVDSRNSKIINIDDGSWLTLVTCWPFDAIRAGGPLRYVVICKLADKIHQGRLDY